MSNFLKFPENFIWGSATSSYQVEGAANEDNRSESTWDKFSHTPGKVLNGDTGDVACDHYHLWKEDIKLMKELDYRAYRFSIAWPRILPDGRGRVNQAGLDFYSRIIDELLNSNILPLITLYHWDIPTAIKGEWISREAVDAFVELTGVVAKNYGDRVKHWVTINEPFCASILSYKYGMHAPGLNDPYKALVAAHHLLLAHGRAVPIIHTESEGSKVGIVLNMGPDYPASTSKADLDAARFAYGEVVRWFIDPLYGRRYPADMLADYRKMGVLTSLEPDFVNDGDLEEISVPTDFLGINYYSRHIVKAGPNHDQDPSDLSFVPVLKEIQTDIGWEVFPYGLYETLMRIYWEYRPASILVTENGASYGDGPDDKGEVKDTKRIEYLQEHLKAIWRVIQTDVPIEGYFAWSLMDNFEWARGYSQRFGLVHVDYETQKRTPKHSAYWYQQVIKQNGLDA